MKYWVVTWLAGFIAIAIITDFFIAPLWISSCSSLQENNSSDTLVLLHVLFRHGDRAPDQHEVYPKDTHAKNQFVSVGYSQLTKAGKRREYLIGKALRSKYDNFLGFYVPDAVSAKSTDYTRTRMSCELVLAGLYPPTTDQQWDETLPWQPIPCDYEAYTDRVLGDPVKHCPPFKKHYEQFLASTKGEQFYKSNKEVYDYLSQNTGWEIKTPKPIYDLYFLFKAKEALGLELPEWAKSVWPNNITILGADEYSAEASTPQMLRIAAGYFLKKMLDDTDLKLNNQLPQSSKIFLYSAHEYNIAFLLKALGLFEPHIPPFGSYIIFELHRINDVYGFKILYQDYELSAPELKLLKLEDCDDFCPIQKFKELIKQYIPLLHDCED